MLRGDIVNEFLDDDRLTYSGAPICPDLTTPGERSNQIDYFKASLEDLGARLLFFKGRRLPVVLSPEEVWRILEAVRFPVYRVCLTTIYTCGLRVSEGISLQVSSVDSARMMLRVLGKGSKEREIPLPEKTLFVSNQLISLFLLLAQSLATWS